MVICCCLRSVSFSQIIAEDQEFINPVSNSSNTVNDTDRPPCYDDIINADLRGEGRFLEVPASIPITPPPAYDEENTR